MTLQSPNHFKSLQFSAHNNQLHARKLHRFCYEVSLPQTNHRLFPKPLKSTRYTITAAASADPYTVLGVSRTASPADIKKAYRKKALKLHPDVNKAPDARDRFMECKNAYQAIVDQQNSRPGSSGRTTGGGSGSTGGFSSRWNSAASGSSSQSGFSERKPQQQEEFYGLSDFFKDLDKELSSYKSKRGSSNEPKSLWEEMADIGYEFVEFLENNIGISDSDTEAARDAYSQYYENRYTPNPNPTSSTTTSKSSSSTSKPPPSNNSGNTSSTTTSSGKTTSVSGTTGSSSRQSGPTPPSLSRTRSEEINDELNALKKKMGLDKK